MRILVFVIPTVRCYPASIHLKRSSSPPCPTSSCLNSSIRVKPRILIAHPFLLARPSSQAAYNRSVSDGGILAAGAAQRFFDRTSGWSSGDVGGVVSRVSVVSGGSKSSFSSLDSATMTGAPMMCKSADINTAWLWEARIEAGLR